MMQQANHSTLSKDRIGIGWRSELAAGIFAHLNEIEIVEVIADDYFAAAKAERRALRTLAAQVPVVLHGVTLGLASAAPAPQTILEQTARLCAEIQPEYWSEHLAFVRGGGIEIGHLSAPPRNAETIAGATANLMRAQRIVGSAPLVENIATLIEPPASDRDELTWINEILAASSCGLLLDLHNLHTNATNFGYDPFDFLARLPVERIRAIHLAGGKWVSAQGERRLLDDHLHDVPPAVYELLTTVGARAPQPLTVILERDGAYPPFEVLLTQLRAARHALAAGRAQQTLAHSSQAA